VNLDAFGTRGDGGSIHSMRGDEAPIWPVFRPLARAEQPRNVYYVASPASGLAVTRCGPRVVALASQGCLLSKDPPWGAIRSRRGRSPFAEGAVSVKSSRWPLALSS
jgi:hypothetical protein